MIPGVIQLDKPPGPVDAPLAFKAGIRLNWNAYFVKFCEVHGRDFVKYKGVLLFPDGWTYSATDKAGPEWPPPTDMEELIALKRAYWHARRAVVKFERDHLKLMIDGLRTLQASKSLPLQHEVAVGKDANGHQLNKRQDLEIDALAEGRLRWLEEDVEVCDEKIKGLS